MRVSGPKEASLAFGGYALTSNSVLSWQTLQPEEIPLAACQTLAHPKSYHRE